MVESASSPIFATGVGLVLYSLENEEGMKSIGEEEAGLFNRIYQWMRHFIEEFF